MACIQLPALATTATCGGLALTLLQSLCCRATLTDLHISRSSVKGVNDAALRNSSYMQGIYIMHRATQLCIQVQRQDGFHLRKKKQLNRLVWLLINDGTSGTSYARSAKLGFSNGTTTLPHTLPLTILPLLPHLVSQLFLKVMDNKERSRISIARTWHTPTVFAISTQIIGRDFDTSSPTLCRKLESRPNCRFKGDDGSMGALVLRVSIMMSPGLLQQKVRITFSSALEMCFTGPLRRLKQYSKSAKISISSGKF